MDETSRIQQKEAPDPDSTAAMRAADGVAADEARASEEVMKSTATMSLATLLSRITGFVRTWAYAFALGNTLLCSAYQVANNLPNMLYELVAGGILTTAFLPIYVTQLKNRGKDGAGAYAGNLMSIAFIALGAVALLATIFAPQVVFTQTFMSNQDDVELTVFFFRFFAIQVMFYGMGAIISGVLNAHKDFLWPALGPVFNNIVVIITMFGYVFFAADNPMFARVWLAVGTSLGVVVMFAVQIPALVKLKIPIRIHIDLRDPALKETIKLALPATVFVVVNLVVVSVRNAFSLGVADNGPATLSYAWLWYQFPYGVLAVALSTAMLTEMSAAAAVKDWPLFRRNVKSGLSGTLYLILPLSAIMFCLAEPLTALYHAGEFNADDVRLVADVLMAWCVSLPFYAAYMYLYRTFSAMKDLGMVTWLDASGRVCQAAMYALFTTGVIDAFDFGLLGIPIADCVFYAVMSAVFCIVLFKKIGSYHLGQVLFTGARALIASLVAAFAVIILRYNFGDWSSIPSALATVAVLGLLGLAIFYVLTRLMRVRETEMIDRVLRRLGSRLFRRSRGKN